MNPLVLWFHKFGSPPYFYRVAGRWTPWLYAIAFVLGAWGFYGGLVMAPADYQQGESFRIMYVHVPCAWMGLFAYGFMAVNGFIALVWRIKISEILAMSAAPVGAAFTFITLVTGSLWGKPMWGTWWTWDARLTSELVLLFLYFGVIGLYHAIEDTRQAARAAAFLALVGVVNLPIVHYSVAMVEHAASGANREPARHIEDRRAHAVAAARARHRHACILFRKRARACAGDADRTGIRQGMGAQPAPAQVTHG